MSLSQRLRTYWAIAEQMLAYALLVPCWLVFVWLFFKKTSIWIGRLNGLNMPLSDPACHDSQCDFSMFWAAGKLIGSKDYVNIYDPAALLQWRHLHLCTDSVVLPWINLPPALLPSYAISFLPFKLGLVVWLFVSMAGATILLRMAKLSWVVIVFGILSPAALFCFECSQLGAIVDAFFIVLLIRLEDRPSLVGGVLGLLILKPQEALLAPFVLLAKRSWSTIWIAAGTLMFVSFFTCVVLGASVWQDYWQTGRGVASQILFANSASSTNYERVGVSVFWMLRSLGASIEASMIFQGISFFLSAALVWYIWQRKYVPQIDRVALTVFLSLLATPYGYTHDMVGYSVMLACLAERGGWRIKLLDIVFWLWPVFCSIVTMDTGVLLTPVVVGLAIIRTWRRAGLRVPLFGPSQKEFSKFCLDNN